MAKILIIDDDRFWRLALKTMLDSQGHEVIEATTGLEGESALAASNIDLVFTDIFMPDQDGLQTIINIRRINEEIPIVAMSAGGNAREYDYLNHATILGASHTFVKPIQPADLARVLETVTCE